MKRCRALALLLWAPTLLTAAGQESPLSELLNKIRSAIDADRAMRHMRAIHATDRFFTFPKFEETAAYIERSMRAAGLQDAAILKAPADGVSRAGFWTMPMAWDIRRGRLEIVEPKVPEELRVLADYEATPTSIGMWSGPTPSDGIEATLIDLGKAPPDTLRKADLQGKLILLSREPAGIKALLAKRGALGTVNAFTENAELKDDRQWINAWGDRGWAFNKGDAPLLSFSITPRQADYVRSLLERHGAVRVRAVVDSRYYEGSYPYATGVIRGSGSDEEVLTLGHTAEQGAHDNATGVAAMLEAMTALRALIASGKLPAPKRTIRLLAMPEIYGSMHYVSTNPKRMRRTVAALCLDTPAGPYHLAGTEYTWYLNPHSSKSYVDAFILRLAREYFSSLRPPRPWRSHAFMPGTDTWLADPTVGVPTVWPYSGTGVHSHHNSADKPETVDPRSLRDLATVTAAFLYFLASAEAPEARWLAGLALDRGLEQLVAAGSAALDRAAAAKDHQALGRLLADTKERLRYVATREGEAVASAGRLATGLDTSTETLNGLAQEQQLRIEAAVKRRAGELGLTGPIAAAPAPPNPEAAGIVVRRKKFGTIPLDDLAVDQREGYPSGAWAVVPMTALFWCDGKRDLAEVIRLTELELGPNRFDFVGYFKFLEKNSYVEFVSPSAVR